VASWAAIAADQPALTDQVESVFAARRLKTLATIRRSGMPRLSEVSGASIRDGEVWLGLIPSAKARDLDRDPRCSIHCGSPGEKSGPSARVSGRAVHASTEPTFSRFTLDVVEIVVTIPDLESRQIRVEWWTAAGGAGMLVRPGG
jgi:hypothetical protein